MLPSDWCWTDRRRCVTRPSTRPLSSRWTPGRPDAPPDLNTANFPFLRGYGLQNYVTDEVFLGRLAKSPKEDRRTAALEWMKVFGNSLRWEDLGWLRSLTRRDRQVRE
jgi:hypothetical protein